MISVISKKNSLRNFDSQIWQQNSFKLDFSDLRSNRKDPIANGSSNFFNESHEKVDSKSDEKKIETHGQKKISLNKKKKVEKD